MPGVNIVKKQLGIKFHFRTSKKCHQHNVDHNSHVIQYAITTQKIKGQ